MKEAESGRFRIDNISIVLDFTALFLYGLLLFICETKGPFSLPVWMERIDGVILHRLIIALALVKAFFYWDESPFKAVVALILSALVVFYRTDVGFIKESLRILELIALMLGVNFKNVVRVYVAVTSTVLAAIFFSVQTGLLTNVKMPDNYTSREVSLLGFGNRNTFMAHWFILMICLIYLLGDNIIANCVLITITAIIWYLTLSKTVFALGVLFCLALIANNLLKRYNSNRILEEIQQRFCIILACMPVICTVATSLGLLVFGIFKYNIGHLSIIDRFGQIYRALVRLGLPFPYNGEALVGVDGVTVAGIEEYDSLSDLKYNIFIGLHGSTYPGPEVMDNIYGKLFVEYGVLVLVSVIAILTVIMFKTYRMKQYSLLVALAMMCVFSIMEATAVTEMICAVMWLVILADSKNTR